MEWIILVVLVPAVIVPIVLLFGFAGCASIVGIGTIEFVEVPPPPPPPPPAVEKRAWVTTYERQPSDPSSLDEDFTGGRCVVQVFPNATVPEGILREMQVTVRASTSQTLTIKTAYASWQAYNAERWDSLGNEAGLTQLPVPAAPVPAGSSAPLKAECHLSDAIALDPKTGKMGRVETELIISFDVDGWGAKFPKSSLAFIGFLEPDGQAKGPDRPLPLGGPTDTRRQTILLIEKIEFLRVVP